MKPRVLVCDDEPHIVRALRLVLRQAGFEVVPAATAAEALDLAALDPPDAAILDVLLPDGTGVEVTEAIRRYSTMPILVLSAVGDEEQKVAALEAGADDYVTKPFGPRELVARLEAVMRRASTGAGDPVLRAGDLEVDVLGRTVRREGVLVHLTPTEFELLRNLMSRPGRLLTHRALLTDVWGPAYADDLATLRTHLARLRRKIEPPDHEGPSVIRTEPGIGYRFTA